MFFITRTFKVTCITLPSTTAWANWILVVLLSNILALTEGVYVYVPPSPVTIYSDIIVTSPSQILKKTHRSFSHDETQHRNTPVFHISGNQGHQQSVKKKNHEANTRGMRGAPSNPQSPVYIKPNPIKPKLTGELWVSSTEAANNRTGTLI